MQIHFKSEVERKMLHLSSLWMAAFLYYFHDWPSVILFSSLFALCLLTEYGYHKGWRFFYTLYKQSFSHILRTEERARKKFHLSGAVYMLLAALICALFFNPEVGAIAMSVMLIGDTAAGLIGRRFGKTKLVGKKSLEGSAAFLAAGLLLIIFFGTVFDFDGAMYSKSLCAIVGATLAELFCKKIRLDDNLAIVLAAGIILSL